MAHRTQLYLSDVQYRWLKQRARDGSSIAGVVRKLIDDARSRHSVTEDDALIEWLVHEPPSQGRRKSSVETLDDDLYG